MTAAPDCPDCRRTMREVGARARSGYMIALDQCGDCGGIWFDRWELFPLHHDEVARLDPVDTAQLQRPVESRRPGDCPRCEVALREFRDANLPADARVARCFVCEGMWLQRGQLGLVKRAANRPPRLPAEEDRELQAVIEAYDATADWSRVADLDAATHETEEAPPSIDDLGAVIKSTLPWVILQVLFRLLLRR